MPQVARLTVSHYPHHVIQRGNRNQRVFFSDRDRQQYLNILKIQSQESKIKIWAWCLMDNHVHFVVVPESEGALARCFGETHKRYTRYINAREGWKGFLWQGRFKSYLMDNDYLHAAVRYVERNPLEAGIVKRPEEYPWSSARARILGAKDPILSKCFLDDEISDWSAFLQKEDDTKKFIQLHSTTGRPLGNSDFIGQLEQLLEQSRTAKK